MLCHSHPGIAVNYVGYVGVKDGANERPTALSKKGVSNDRWDGPNKGKYWTELYFY